MAIPSPRAERIFGFHAASTRQLRRAGFEGDFVWAGMRGDALELIGEKAGFLRIPAADVARMRTGFVEGKYRSYRTLLWLRGGGPPIRLYPRKDHYFLYVPTVRGLAEAVAGEGGMARIETGTSTGDALLGPLMMAIPALGALAIAAFAVTDAAWWQRLAIPAIPVAAFALLGWRSLTRHAPRRATALADLDRQLPPT